MCEKTHCAQRYTVRSPFRVNCERKIPLSQFFYTSAAIDAMDKYQVCPSPPRKISENSSLLGSMAFPHLGLLSFVRAVCISDNFVFSPAYGRSAFLQSYILHFYILMRKVLLEDDPYGKLN